MNYTEVIEGQVGLLVDLNLELAKQSTPDAAQEIRENIRLIVDLVGEHRYHSMESMLHTMGDIVDDLEERITGMEEVVFPEEDEAGV
jgi:hypothetical protein